MAIENMKIAIQQKQKNQIYQIIVLSLKFRNKNKVKHHQREALKNEENTLKIIFIMKL